jgi:hypothetical protein
MTPRQAKEQRRALMREIEREHKKKARETLLALIAELRAARLERRGALAAAKKRCKDEKLAARVRARERRRRLLEELRQATRDEKAAARATCDAAIGAARGLSSRVAQRRAELHAERAYRRDLRRIERGNRARVLEHKRSTARERRGESDDEVRGNIPPELTGLWERVRTKIRGGERHTRTEAFLQYAHDHPEEVLAGIEDRTETLIAELEAKELAARKALRSKPPPGVYSDVVPF